ncbi:furin-like protease kpc-1 isoform X1 [Mya arenaria]|uniref:furin-like protease kpc-1 isoform X1 n=1 Tax=Mya arenaria TaxID=6604 RepID=UPI0022E8673C|nr:furin-like protease kpc-1 isoform X1 [Mya arenaria]
MSRSVSSWLLDFLGISVILSALCLQIAYSEHFINKFAVHIPGGERKAREVADSHGYIHLGQIGSLEDHYLFEHPHVHRRSADRNLEHHEKLSTHDDVHWFEQQQVLSRKKRDFLPMSGDVAEEKDAKRVSRDATGRDSREVNRELYFNDELYKKMWYYNGGGKDHTDMNVHGAWQKGVTGKNVVITILDDGIERTHDDLKDNYDPYASYDVNGHDPDPMPRYDYTNENRHGTRCAGEVSAKANNTKCIVGVAYDSKIGGVRMLDGDVYDAVEATSLSHNRSHIDIYSASWGPDDDGRVVDGPGTLAKKAFEDGVKMGRHGKGAIFVWASGNGGRQHDSCSCDGYTNSIYTLSISGVSQNILKPFYLEECASTLATTFSSGGGAEKKVVTVDLHNKCTETHTGTSASAPLAAGIVALILEINPGLTWRDVQYITLMTARPLSDGVWTSNGVGRKVSLRYGYGLMDATAMVELAEKWTNVPQQHVCDIQSENVGKTKPKLEIPDSGYEEILSTQACAGQANAINFLEHVQAKVTVKSKRRGDLVIHLTSPAGTRSTILPQRPNDSDRMKGFQDWAFLSVHFWGENPVGQWKLEIEVQKNSHGYVGSYGGAQMTNDLIDWSLILYGTEDNPVNLVKPTHPTVEPATKSSTGCHVQCEGGCSGPEANQCISCKNYHIPDQSLCVETCPNNFYADSYECRECHSSCETCTQISENKVMCMKCKPGFLLVEGKGTCEKTCEKGYYKNEASHHCRVCSGVCAECEGSSSHCSACGDGQQLNGKTCVYAKECATGEYLEETGNCHTCPDSCFSCTSADNCTCCDKGSYLQNGSCVHSCDNGYQPFHVNYSSKFVFQQCQHCGDRCNVCPEGFNYVTGVCIQQQNCPEGTYFQWNSMSCKSCTDNCRACIGPSQSDCLACVAPYGYNNLLRRCMTCCSALTWSRGDKDCCKCVEDGKCDISAQPPESSDAKQLFSVATLIVVLLVIVITCLSIFVVVAVWIGCRRNGADKSGYRYSELKTDDMSVDIGEAS